MKMKTSELTGGALNWAVAQCQDFLVYLARGVSTGAGVPCLPY